MSWKKINRELTADQRARGVVFSSQLVNYTLGDTEDTALVHEVIPGECNVPEKIDLLTDVSFFKRMARDMGYRVVEIVRS